MPKKVDQPIFIIGFGRSGTTIISNIVGAHSKIAIPYKLIRFWDDLYKKYKNTNFVEKTEKLHFLGESLEYFYGKGFFGFDDLYTYKITNKIISLQSTTFKEMIITILSEYLKKENKNYWGIKEPRAINYVSDIMNIFPKAKIIHMIRDPRRIITSWKREKRGDHLVFDASIVKKIGKSFRFGLEYNKSLPGSYSIVKFEDLISNPENTVQKICDFLEVDFEPGMLEMKNSVWKGHDSGFSDMEGVKTISTIPLQRPERLTNFELYYLETALEYELETFAYERKNLTLQPNEYAILYRLKIIQLIDYVIPFLAPINNRLKNKVFSRKKWRAIKEKWGFN